MRPMLRGGALALSISGRRKKVRVGCDGGILDVDVGLDRRAETCARA